MGVSSLGTFLRECKVGEIKITSSRCDWLYNKAANPLQGHPKGVQSGQADDINSFVHASMTVFPK